MNNKQFYQRLQKKIPAWQAQGWLDQNAADNILQDSLHDCELGQSQLNNSSDNKSHRLSLILSMMGVILLAVGAVSFFAANWQGMSKLLKLSLLFSSMTAAYLAAAWALSQQRHPALGQAFLLLGVLLFGNNIMLIAQIYHIDSHYPNGILLWASGALLTTLIIRSEAVLAAALILSLIWTGMETFDFRLVHWQWLIFWALSSLIIMRQGYRIAAHISVFSLFLWLLFNFNNLSRYISDGYIMQLYLLLGIAVFLLAETIKTGRSTNYLMAVLSRYSFSFAVLFLYVLSFPELDLYTSFRSFSSIDNTYVQLISLLLMFMILSLVFIHLQRQQQTRRLYKWPVFLWLLILFSILLHKVFFSQGWEDFDVISINILLFVLVAGLLYLGINEQQHFYVNAAFMIFTITLISRYFDTFWGLMNRSLFFFSGGIILILGGYWLEKKRRQLNEKIERAGSTYE